MEYSQNEWSAGLNKDLNKGDLPANQYTHAENFRVLTDKGSSSFSLENIKGNVLVGSIPNIGAVQKLTLIGDDPSQIITINSSGTVTFDTTNKSTQDIYNLIATDSHFASGFNIQYNVYYNNLFVLIVPIGNNSLTITVLGGGLSLDNNYIPAQTNLEVIGNTSINDDIYLLTTNCTTKDPGGADASSYGQIWRLLIDNSSNTILLQLIYENLLDFTTYYAIAPTAITGRYENSAIQRIYWTDFNNPIRSLNVANPQAFAVDLSLIDLSPSVDFDIPILTDIRSGGTPIPVGVYQVAYRLKNTGGSVTNFSEFSNMVFAIPSNESDSTGGNNFKDYVGGSFGAMASKSMTFEINNIDTDFERIEIVVLFRDRIDGIPTINSIYDDSLNGLDSYTFVFDGSQKETSLSLSDFLLLSGSITHAKTLTTKDNRLILGNIKNSGSGAGDIDYDARAYRWELTGSSFQIINRGILSSALSSGSYSSILDTNDAINPSYIDSSDPNYVSGYLYNTATNLGGEGPNISYEFYTVDIAADRDAGPTPFKVLDNGVAPWRLTNPRYDLTSGVDLNLGVSSITNTGLSDLQVYNTRFPNPINDGFKYPPINSLYRGYQRNEIYRFGIQFYDKNKNPYFVKWIGDIQFPDFWDTNNNAFYEDGTTAPHTDFRTSHVANKVGYSEAFVRALGIKFTVNNINTIKDKISGYSIVRVKREKSDRTIVSQGYLSKTIVATSSAIYTTSPSDNADGNVWNTNNGAAIDSHKNFYITPDICDTADTLAPQLGDFLNIKTLVTTANSDNSMVVGSGDPYYYFKNYNQTSNKNTPRTELTGNLLNIPYGSSGIAGAYTVFNFDYDNASGSPNYTISHSIGNQAYYIETANNAVNYSSVINGAQLLCNIERTLSAQYGGNTYTERAGNEYIYCNHYQPIRTQSPNNFTFKVFSGDIFINMYDSCRWAKNWGATGRGLSSPKISSTFFLAIESIVNTDLRNGFYMNKDFTLAIDTGTEMRENYLYNSVYSSENTIKSFFPKPDPFILNNEYVNRFQASEIKINGELSDSWSVFLSLNYWDVEGTYGPINACDVLEGEVYFAQDRAFGKLSVNPRVAITSNTGDELEIGKGDILERHIYVSTEIGSKHQFSFLKSSYNIFFLDIRSKKIYKFNPSQPLDPITDVKGLHGFLQLILNNGIEDIDKPVYISDGSHNGIHGVYDYTNNELIYTIFEKKDSGHIENKYTLVYSEKMNTFIGFYTHYPKIYITNHRRLLSPDPSSSTSYKDLYLHNYGEYGKFYGNYYDSIIEFLSNKYPEATKVFDNILWDSEVQDGVTFIDIASGNSPIQETFTGMILSTNYQSNNIIFNIATNLVRRFRTWKTQVLRNSTASEYTSTGLLSRMKDKYLRIRFYYTNHNNRRLLINKIQTFFRLQKPL